MNEKYFSCLKKTISDFCSIKKPSENHSKWHHHPAMLMCVAVVMDDLYSNGGV